MIEYAVSAKAHTLCKSGGITAATMIDRRRRRMGDCRRIVARKKQFNLFIRWAVPAMICAIAAAQTPDQMETTLSSENKSVNNVWGAVIGATLLVNLATFSGVLIMVITAMKRGYLKYRGTGVPGTPVADAGKGGRMLDIVLPGFAVGALIATAVFLIFPEALHQIGGVYGGETGDGDGEAIIAAKFGCSILGGFLLPLFFSIFLHVDDEGRVSQPRSDEKAVKRDTSASSNETLCDCRPEADADAETGIVVTAVKEEDEDIIVDTPAEAPVVKPVVNKRLCATILLGDSFHNFSDGLFIAAAFRSCSQSLAIGITLVTLAHEIPQELADFLILTQYAGLSVSKALLLNFLSGLSVLFGGIIFLASNPSAEATGVILAMGGGVYINVAASEAIPRMEASLKVRWDRLLMLFSIILGAIPIGLMLFHQLYHMSDRTGGCLGAQKMLSSQPPTHQQEK